jgi:hypothetical protein
MKLKNKKFKALIDFVLISLLAGCFVSTSAFDESKRAVRDGVGIGEAFHWGTSHCIISLMLCALILFHIWQHWGFIKTMVLKKNYSKNLIVTLSLIFFFMAMISISMYMFGFTFSNLHFHSLITHLFVLLSIIHLVTKTKNLINLLKTKDLLPQFVVNPEKKD